ncbi:molybdopterin-binding protein [Brucella sp. BE17]|uniref:molybdopterin-binding protein n=1 Tax=Brucella sp. BE17 TaxID=3142977 RepID=UPI0031BA9A1F
MIFAELPLEEAEGAVLAYAVDAGTINLRKGTTLTAEHIALLRQGGCDQVLAARFEHGDIGEDEAARRIGEALATTTIAAGDATAGRINLFAQADGVFCANKASVDALNALDPSISLATLYSYTRVEKDQMVATIKIIPFAIPESSVDAVCSLLGKVPAVSVEAFRPLRVGLVQSRLPSTRDSVLDKTRDIMKKRVARNGGQLVTEQRVAHDTQALAAAIGAVAQDCDILVMFSASAVADAADILPRSILMSGGKILRIGVPVDPGNLLVLGKRRGKYIIAAPGSARSVRGNSLDPVLDRLMAGIDLNGADLARMGVGGLLL